MHSSRLARVVASLMACALLGAPGQVDARTEASAQVDTLWFFPKPLGAPRQFAFDYGFVDGPRKTLKFPMGAGERIELRQAKWSGWKSKRVSIRGVVFACQGGCVKWGNGRITLVKRKTSVCGHVAVRRYERYRLKGFDGLVVERRSYPSGLLC